MNVELRLKSDASDLTDDEKHTLFICTRGSNSRTVSRVPFSHLVASYQAALKNVEATLAIIKRTEHADVVGADKDIIVAELSFIQEWLDKQFATLGKWTLGGAASAGVAAIGTAGAAIRAPGPAGWAGQTGGGSSARSGAAAQPGH